MPILEFNLDERSAFERTFHLSRDARLPPLDVRLLDGAAAQDLTSAVVTFSMQTEAGVVKVNNATAILQDAVDGRIRYEWAALDVDTEGTFFGQFTISEAGKAFRIPNGTTQKLRIIIGPRIN